MKGTCLAWAFLAAVALCFGIEGRAQAETASETPAMMPDEKGAASESPATARQESLLHYRLPVEVLSLELSAACAFTLANTAPNVIEQTGFKGGPGGALSLIYRPDYPISGFLEGGYLQLSKTTDHVKTSAGMVEAENSLAMWNISVGLLADVWYLRARFGLALQNLLLNSRVDGVDASSNQFNLGYLFGLSAFFYRGHGFQVGAEWRTYLDPVPDVTTFTLGLMASWDFLSL